MFAQKSSLSAADLDLPARGATTARQQSDEAAATATATRHTGGRGEGGGGGGGEGVVPVPPRPVLPTVVARRKQITTREDPLEKKTSTISPSGDEEFVGHGTAEEGADEEEEEKDVGGRGSVIMFGNMGRGARTMLDSINDLECKTRPTTTSSSPDLVSSHRPLDEDDDDDGEAAGVDQDVDLRPMKKYMRNLTLRLTEQSSEEGKESRDGREEPDRSKVEGGGGGKGGKNGTIRLYCAMKKGHQRLQQSPSQKSENDQDSESENEGENEEEGEDAKKRKKAEEEKAHDAWEAKRKQLSQSKKNDPVFVWKTLTKRSNQVLDAKEAANVQEAGNSDPEELRKRREYMLRQEFLKTEATYVQNLGIIIKVFLNPLKEMASDEHNAILSPQQIELIFGRVVPLHIMHTELLSEFKKAESKGASFADAFHYFVPYLKVYTAYVNKHPSAIDQLFKMSRSNPRFRRFLDDCFTKAGMDVESFLILPIQRLPRYELLLTDLVKQTIRSTNLEEHQKLKVLLAQVKEINQAVEDSRKREENLERMYSIHKRLVFPSREAHLNLFDRPSRAFIREGHLQLCTNLVTKRFSPRYFFLFDDIMLCTKKRGDGYKFEYLFELRRIIPRVDGPDIVALGGDLVFGLVDKHSRTPSDSEDEDDNDDKSRDINSRSAESNTLYLKASSALDRSQWIEQLQELCSRWWTRVHFVRSKHKADTVPVLPRRTRSSTGDGERSSSQPALNEPSGESPVVVVPPRPSVYRKLSQKATRLRRRSGEIAHHLLGSSSGNKDRAENH